ncbi:uncharacterized protein CELE_F47B7.4 [Caenorhabditis elegans]|uniref:Secreted protein n=1 Tax=Caenorhabditis elegans TaxID=6239 RepID=Q20511_CAEEL|nr:Secreted protein [Caenorhabditis elegans]CCD70495.1 Secreted protein [Caenorhabditis elegans]|eukprot:NP_508649.2 Uncharacterized protein CELE_F47B7.4 [Caenorhabditis elegans]
MNILTFFLTIPYLMVVSECCMRMVPPDDVYIPSTLAPEQSTLVPGEITMAPEESTMAPEDTTMAPGGVSTPETSEETEAPEVTMMTTMATESSTVTEETCPTSTTKCPDLSTIALAPMMVQEVDGCAVFSCPPGLLPYGYGSLVGTELTGFYIPPGEDTFRLIRPVTLTELNGGTVNDFFGISCENNKLIVSKYPRGISVGITPVGTEGLLSGKSSMNTMRCS